MRYGIHWEMIPGKIPELMPLFMKGKIVVPEDIKVVEEYIWGNRSLEIVETESIAALNEYIMQFLPYVRNFKTTPLVTLSELMPKPS